jgi:L-ascorbate metabolism protein UlaG (beta-lactamase superfamily)
VSIHLTWLGHSALELRIDGHTVAIDPFLSGNPLAAKHADQLQPEIIFLSHAHGDHLGDTLAIAQRTHAKVVANHEIAAWCSTHGAPHTHGQNPGGSFNHGFVTAKWTIAHHSSSFPDGSYGGQPNGMILTGNDSGKRLYFAGDTGLFGDMKLIGDHALEIACVPIGDNYTMGIDDSIFAIRMLRPKYVLPIHYNTFPMIMQDVHAWALRVVAETDATPIVVDPGGEFELS